MRARSFALTTVLPLLTLGLLLVGSRPALAEEVMCSNAFGECTVSNNGFDEVTCNCEGSGFGSTGGDSYAGLTEAELLDVCNGFLADCEDIGGETGETGWVGETGETGETGWMGESGDWGESESGDWGESEETGDWGETGQISETDTGEGDGDGDNSTSGDGDGDPNGDGDPDWGTGDGDGDSAGDGDGDGDPNADGETTGDTNTDDGNNQDESGGSGESGTDTGAAEDGAGGCSCSATSQAPGIGLMLLSLFGLVRLRRQESRA